MVTETPGSGIHTFVGRADDDPNSPMPKTLYIAWSIRTEENLARGSIKISLPRISLGSSAVPSFSATLPSCL